MAASMMILKTKHQIDFHWSLPVFTVVMVISVWTHYNYDDYKMKTCALLISFWSKTANGKKNWIKESVWIFLTKFCQYYLSKDIKILCMHYQKRSLQYFEEKNTFLRCENLRVSRDLKHVMDTDLLCKQKQVVP